MIKFSNNMDNDEYLIIDVHIDGGLLLASDILSTFASIELEKMYLNLFSFEKEIETYINKVSFRKDSALGQWLINNFDQNKIIFEESSQLYSKDKEYVVFENGKYCKKIFDNKKLTKNKHI